MAARSAAQFSLVFVLPCFVCSGYCSRRVRRLRTAKGIKMTQGRGRKYERKDVTADKVTDVRHLHIPLFQAEGAWAFAMNIKAVRLARLPALLWT